MIVCKNCGAKFNKNKLNCPYCQYENVVAAQENYHKEMDKAIAEREQLKLLPDKIARKNQKVLLTIVAVLSLVIVLVISSVIYYTKYGPQSKIQIEKNNKAVMETYLENGDYSGLRDYYEDLRDNYSVYEKYAEIRNLYEDYEELEWRINEIKYYFPTSRKEEQIEQVAKAMKELKELHNYYDACINDTRRLANEKYLEEIWTTGKNIFMQAYFVDESILLKVLEIEYEKDISVYDELAESIADNMLLYYK